MTAQNEYATKHAQVLDLLADIQEEIENMPAPHDGINWGDVGPLGYIAEKLNEVKSFIKNDMD